MKILARILTILITTIIELPIILVYMRSEISIFDFWVLLSLAITAIYAQKTGNKFYDWFNSNIK